MQAVKISRRRTLGFKRTRERRREGGERRGHALGKERGNHQPAICEKQRKSGIQKERKVKSSRQKVDEEKQVNLG